MAQRRNAEHGLIDGMTSDLGGPRTRDLLKRLDAAVPWDRLVEIVSDLAVYQNRGAGRAAWPPATMLRCLMLAKWFNLSDPQLEECLQDRLSFRRFVGLALEDATPDETTFVKFRRRLREAKLHDRIFEVVVKHIDEQGLLVREGTLVDATIIRQSTGGRRDDGSSTRDADASFTRKGGQSHHGYKGHIAADRSGIIVRQRYSTAKHHDSRYIDEMVEDESHAVFADAAYADDARRERYKARGVFDGIAHRRRRGQGDLSPLQQVWNREVARIRATVEHPFGMIKSRLGHQRVRYRGLERNAFDFAMVATAANLLRSLSLRSG